MAELALAPVRALASVGARGPCAVLLVVNRQELVQGRARSAKWIFRRHESGGTQRGVGGILLISKGHSRKSNPNEMQ